MGERKTIKYVIPREIRDLHVTGVFGSIQGKGQVQVHLHFFSERPAIPKEEIIELDENGNILDVDTKKGADVIRLIQTSVSMDVDTAIKVKNWLETIIGNHMEKLKNEPNS